jgi:uncharacterized protein (DUF2126 family)
VALALNGDREVLDGMSDALIAREPAERQEVGGAEVIDELAALGIGLIMLGAVEDELSGRSVLRAELPAMPEPSAFRRLLGALADGLVAARVGEVVLGGFPPPVDRSVAWTTFTADPAVVEVNMAPAASAVDFHVALRAIHGLVSRHGLAPSRLHYNGLETDSGGGGQITLGGPRPEASPFFLHPQLLPGVVRYFNRHPSLSYYWSPETAGAASQGPRPDEGARQSFRELDLALALLESDPAPSPEVLQRALSPFLVDASGNPHRAEMNVEKLCSDRLGERGRQGLVEFRALRMAREPELLAAQAALLRALAAMVAASAPRGALVDWGDRLHDRYSLPFYLREDLRQVLDELRSSGFGLGPRLEALLLDDSFHRIADVALPDAVLSLSRGVEFWPLIGDAASQEQGGARLVDASTARVELRLHGGEAGGAPEGWRLSAAGWILPAEPCRDERGACVVCGVRYRQHAPAPGLHPTLPAQGPLRIHLAHPRHGHWQLELHDWRPGGGAYDGLPADRTVAAARRAERCVLARCAAVSAPSRPPPAACGEHVLDLRWLAAAGPGEG